MDPEETEYQDALAAQRAAIDQFAENAPEFARLNYSIYKSHIDAGFPPEAALSITQQMVAIFVASWGL